MGGRASLAADGGRARCATYAAAVAAFMFACASAAAPPAAPQASAGPTSATAAAGLSAGQRTQLAASMVNAPDAKALAFYFPEKAQRAGVGGHVVMSCGVSAQGAFQNCQVVSETPSGFAFGLASKLVIERTARAKPPAQTGIDHLVIPIDWAPR